MRHWLHRGRLLQRERKITTNHKIVRGFTLIELMVSLAILASLAAALLPMTEFMARRHQEQELRDGLREIRTAIDAYKQAADDGAIEKMLDASGYPANLEVLQTGVANKENVNGGKRVFLRRLPRDPMCNCPDTPAAETWQLRSYDSAFDSPQSGEDVFDITSTNTEEGLNGIPYNQW
ncbi:type II secretion system protein [Glaciimonas sp. PCH181]|uniref:type II secretion system protein n=1 Tax=Glaciimonas sp. PCH181 TaxID=2133943 RepID=UPI000D383D20|nr:type II secretion system protein [Glaciimonas sp. PCH181]PUA18843.1 general secretion pathway protein GspG [Glaciimonas sp. PCH181]